MPLTWGWWRPVVLLPAEATTWPAERRRVVLLHELAHAKRWDCLTQTVARVVCALYWINPLAWVAARRMCAERERACDDLVLNSGCRASEYATHLVDIARTFRRVPQFAGIAMARSPQLQGRIAAIVDASRARRLRPLTALAILGFMGALRAGRGREKPGFGVQPSVGLPAAPGAACPIGVLCPSEGKAVGGVGRQGRRANLPRVPTLLRGRRKRRLADCDQPVRVSSSSITRNTSKGPMPWTRASARPIGSPCWSLPGLRSGRQLRPEIHGAPRRRDHRLHPRRQHLLRRHRPRARRADGLLQVEIDGDPFFTLTQNALADGTYLEYLRAMYGGKIYTPTGEDSQHCFQEYMADASDASRSTSSGPART